MILAAEAATTGSRILTSSLFIVLVAATLGITVWASRRTKTATDFYAGGRGFSGVQNGLAIGGDYMSAASFLGIAGMISLFGYDGFLYSIGFLVAWLVALLLVAELLRNSGRFTMADVVSHRMRQRPVRTAAAFSTITVSIFYLLAQMVGAGALVALLLGIQSGQTFLGMTGEVAKNGTIVLVGILMIVYVTFGGMKGTTWVQIVKAVMLMTGAALLTLLVLGVFGFNVSQVLGQAADSSGEGRAFLEPGLNYWKDSATALDAMWSKLDMISLGLALVLGTAGLPHILIRFYTVPNSKAARTSVNWAILLIGVFYLMTLVLGFGATAVVGRDAIEAQDPAGNTAAPQLARAVGEMLIGSWGGAVMLALIAAVAFATILAVVAGLTLASSSSLAHDFYANVVRRGNATEQEEVRVARVAALFIGAVSIVLAIFAQGLNVAFLVALAFAVAASANLPALLLSLFWSRFNTTGAVAGIYGGLVAAVGLVFFSPVVSGKVDPETGENLALFPAGVDFAWFPLENPGLVSIPVGFLCAIIGTLLSRERDPQKHAVLEVRSITGAGAH